MKTNMNEGEPVVRRRPRVLIVPNTVTWIVGEMAVQIMKRFGHEYEFWCVTDKLIQLRPDLIRALAPTLDFIFPLSDKGFQLLKQVIGPSSIPSIFWVHHVSSWNADVCEAVSGSSELIACTEEWKGRIQERFPNDSSVTVVPHGVDLDQFRRVPQERTRLGMPEDSFVVGFVSSKRSDADGGRKGLDILRAVLERVNSRIPNLHVSFMGQGWDEEVESLRRKGISANYVGFVPQGELATFYSSIDTYLMTSRIEGGPCTVLEAMACETPVVATRVGLVPQTISDNVNGFSTDIDDVESLAQSVYALAIDPDLRKAMGVAAGQRVNRDLSWQSTLTALDVPLSRMASLSSRANRSHPAELPSSIPANFCRAAHVLDVVMSATLDLGRGWVGPKAALSMLTACLRGFRMKDLMGAFTLAARLSFKPSLFKQHV